LRSTGAFSTDRVEVIVYEAGVSFEGAGGINGILSGTTAPASNLGNEGDFYINTATYEIYGPKANGLWGNATLIKGPQGDQGVQGEQGPAGADANVTDISINAAKQLVLEVSGQANITYDISPFIRLMVGDVEILKKAGTDPAAIETGDVVSFYDSTNDDRKVEGVVKDGAVDVKTFDNATKRYTNLKTYINFTPST